MMIHMLFAVTIAGYFDIFKPIPVEMLAMYTHGLHACLRCCFFLFWW